MSRDLRKRRTNSNGKIDDQSKRFKTASSSGSFILIESHSNFNPTQFDHLPNEIYREIFDYLPISDILHGFHGLNARLDAVIADIPMKFRFDQRNRQNFKRLLKQMEPTLIPQVVAMDFGPSFDPEYMIEKFTQSFHFLQFTHLRDLSIASSNSQQIESLLRILPRMTNLRSFRLLEQYPFRSDYETVCDLVLANNRHCSLAVRNSFKHISIETSPPFRNLLLVQKCLTNELSFDSLHLKTRCALFFYPQAISNLPVPGLIHLVPHATYCHINLILRPYTMVFDLVRCFPQISHLSIRTSLEAYANGYQWKELLSQLPNIIDLDLDIHQHTSHSDHELLSFQTKFWFERNWIVQSRANRSASDRCIFQCRTPLSVH